MSLKNACYISYRHGQFELMQEFIADFRIALCCELEPILHSRSVYLDRERLSGGEFYDHSLAQNLYESATMVLIYTPTYFDAANPYCAREYSAMLVLERERLDRLLACGSAVNHGLIIPVVLRGCRYLPNEIKERRQYYNFEDFQLGGRRLSRHPRFAPVIRQIATYICERYEELLRLPDETFRNGALFELPGEADVARLLAAAAVFRPPFPRGDISCAQALSAVL